MEKAFMLNETTTSAILAVVRALAEKPLAAEVRRVHNRFDLEFIIRVASEDRPKITEEVCLALTTLLKAMTGVLQPIVYLEDEPHPKAAESLAYALSQC